MADTVTTVANQARIFLNDVGAQLYTTSVLLPYIQAAYDELQSELTRNGIQVTKEVSGLFTVLAVTSAPKLTVTDIPDIVQPIELLERPNGSSDLFVRMKEIDWEPEDYRTDQLRYWIWRENEIKFLGANIDVQVKVRYRKSLADFVDANSTIGVIGARLFLAARAAAIASFAVGGSESRAAVINSKADGELESFIAAEVKRNQRLTTRRRPFRRKSLLYS